jgi:hypothetical protein
MIMNWKDVEVVKALSRHVPQRTEHNHEIHSGQFVSRSRLEIGSWMKQVCSPQGWNVRLVTISELLNCTFITRKPIDVEFHIDIGNVHIDSTIDSFYQKPVLDEQSSV